MYLLKRSSPKNIGANEKIFKELMLFHSMILEPRPNTSTPDPGAIKFIFSEEAFFLITTMYLVYGLNTRAQKRRFSKY